jgi:outer membrane protein, heavy metal efflux system
MTTTSATAAALAVAVLPIRAETFQKVQTEVRDRSGADIRWEKQMAAREETAAVVAKLLRQPLTVASAVQIALISNRGLQATFGEIGIAQSDVIEAVTVPNPSVDFDVQFPVVAAQMNRYGWLVAQEFVQILMIPLKKKIAGERLEAAKLRVAAETLRLVAEVKAAYFTYQGDQQLLARLKIIQETNAPRSTSPKNSLRRAISPISRCSNPKAATVRGGLTW